MKALSDAAAILRQAGGVAGAQALEHRAHTMLKAEPSGGNSSRLFLAARSLRRAETEKREQEAAAQEDARRKELDALFRLAKGETAAKRASAGEAREETRRMMIEAEAQRKSHKEKMERRRANWLYVQQHLAADLVSRAYTFLQHKTLGAARAAALRLLITGQSGSKEWMEANRAVVDPAWDGDARVGYIVITPLAAATKGKLRYQKEWASERTARAVFGGRDPKEAKTAEAAWSRLGKLLSEIAPGYDYMLFKGCHLADDLLQRHSRNVDLCVIAVLQRYCMLVPDTHYPCQVRTWPWGDDQLERWVESHRATNEKSLARAKSRGGDAAMCVRGSRSAGEAPATLGDGASWKKASAGD